MATKFLAITFFFSLVVILPIQRLVGEDGSGSGSRNDTGVNDTTKFDMDTIDSFQVVIDLNGTKQQHGGEKEDLFAPTNILWMYVVFVYFFTGLAFYLIVTETKAVIRIRQKYLGKKSTITERTIRLSGIPPELRSEEKIKDTIEKLKIGKVESVMLCRDWQELDDLIEKRASNLRKLEEAWTVQLGQKAGLKNLKNTDSRSHRSAGQVDVDRADEESRLLDDESNTGRHDQSRPKIRIWYGFLSLQSRRVDAIDYYVEKLRKLDEQIKSARKKDYKPMSLAFVTLNSAAACVSPS